jgi:hypothetical protein
LVEARCCADPPWYIAPAISNDLPHSPFRLVSFELDVTARTRSSSTAPYALEQSNRASPFNVTSTSGELKHTKLPWEDPHFVAQLSITLLPEFTRERYAQPPPYLALQFRKEQL